MAKTRKRIIAALLLMAMLLPVLSGCGGGKTKEQIFTKTIHDFEGHLVVNLDEQEDTNFAAYAKDVERIIADGKVNRIVGVDEENCVYTFANASDSLKNLQPGQVFFVEASSHNPTGATGKVKEVKTDGANTVVYCEPVSMEELFAYVDIDMNLDLSQAYYDASSLEEGMEIEVISTADSAGAGEAGIVPLAGDFNWSGSKGVELVVRYGTELAIGKSHKGVGAAGHFKTENTLAIKAVRAQLYYDSESGFFSMDVSADVEQSTVNSVDFEGSWSNGRGGMGHTWPEIGFFIPGTPIAVGVEEYLLITLSGGMKGSYEQSSGATFGLTDKIQDLRDFSPESYYQETGKRSTAKLELEGKLEIMFGIRVNVGIPFVIDLFLEGGVGARATGSLAMIERESDYLTSDSIHDCDKCLDGDVELVSQCNWGIDARLLTTITGYDLVLRKTLAENTTKIGDFYASYREDAENGVECGWGECPHLRWKCTVTVVTEENDPAQYAYVNAAYPDGREDKRMTDEDGVAVFYLPNGDNLLKCSFQGQRGSANANVNGCPTTAKISLEDKQQLFVVYSFLNGARDDMATDSDWSSLKQQLQDQLDQTYPEAILVPNYEFESIGLSDYAGLQTLNSMGDLGPGDIVLYVRAWRHHYYGDCLRQDYDYMAEEASVPGSFTDFDLTMSFVTQYLVKGEDGKTISIPSIVTLGTAQIGLNMHPALVHTEYGNLHYEISDVEYEGHEWVVMGHDFDDKYQLIYSEDSELKTITQEWEEMYLLESENTLSPKGFVLTADWDGICGGMIRDSMSAMSPYIDLLLENNWAEGLEEMYGGSEVGIEVPQQ